MMHDGMMWGIGIGGVLVLVIAVLVSDQRSGRLCGGRLAAGGRAADKGGSIRRTVCAMLDRRERLSAAQMQVNARAGITTPKSVDGTNV